MDTNLKTLFAFDEQGNLVFQAESLELPVIYHPSLSADLSIAATFQHTPISQVSDALVGPTLGSVLRDAVRVFGNLLSTTVVIATRTVSGIVKRIPKRVSSLAGVVASIRDYFRYTGTVRLLGNGLIMAGVIGLTVSFYPIVSSQISYYTKQFFGPKDASTVSANSGFAPLITEKPKITLPALTKEPLNKDFGVMIDKIDVNAPVVGNVNSADYNAYMNALKSGAAHALGTAVPGQKTADGNGNTFIFAHSTLNLWEVPRYNAIFILLNKLEPGDRITTFYKGLRYDYIVASKKIVEADDVKYLTEPSTDQILTLQTCDPPGTNLRRLIITAKLVNEEGAEQ